MSYESRLLPSERQQRIRQLALEQQVLRVSDLSELYGVSEMTIRRDLEALEGAGHIERTFGGAIAAEQTAFESSYKVRLQSHIAQKEAIADYANSLIQDGDTVAIDASTTALILAKKLYTRTITVVTNSLDSAYILRHGQAKVILIGGYLREVSGSFTGPLATQVLKHLRVDQAFISAKALHVPDGLMESDISEAEIKTALIASASIVNVMVDSSKFGKRALIHSCSLKNINLLISDDGLSPEYSQALKAHDIDFYVAKTSDVAKTGDAAKTRQP